MLRMIAKTSQSHPSAICFDKPDILDVMGFFSFHILSSFDETEAFALDIGL